MKISDFGGKNLTEDFVQLFNTLNVEQVWMHYRKSYLEKKWLWTAKIEYKKGDLSGEKRFKSENIDDVMDKINLFLQKNE